MLRRRRSICFRANLRSENENPCGSRGLEFGGAREGRTPDLLTASQALSQLSYSPNGGPSISALSTNVNDYRVGTGQVVGILAQIMLALKGLRPVIARPDPVGGRGDLKRRGGSEVTCPVRRGGPTSAGSRRYRRIEFGAFSASPKHRFRKKVSLVQSQIGYVESPVNSPIAGLYS